MHSLGEENNLKQKFIPAARFNLLTPLFDAFCSLVGLGKGYRKKILEVMNIPQQKLYVMDAGCGSGSLAIDVKKAFPDISLCAIDADPQILRIAENKARKTNQQINFREAFLQQLPFPEKSFDVVYSSLVFHHLTSDIKEKAMKEVYRVLKNGGRFLLVDFGKPKHTLFSVFSWFTVLFEEGFDNYNGKMPELMMNAGFSNVREKSRYRFNIVYLEGLK
ncbi:MAG: hypothetical protein A2730_03725 [Candidatus Staskawiczbacteria bacterium RIFCSPHIGHO2_01_FULL_39_25]|uniref:Methyltransferase domain-containing protein n=1 Tax=Candidatus Staskawiczbacteria bacterium RIFCSPHIGHO2_01_FULL_39_25 TaxID=1802202 RepID=A0A1G2HQU6_9BACT|nr:MAG: hypothetical protein A2730_03725 [Candidatus Staskawiczbacteria bacterium RIFCSPHIGHO2_01_FULL_39_25]